MNFQRLRVLRSDNASEFNSAEIQQICRNNSIKREFSNPGQQFQNGKGEKCIGDVWLMTKTILLFSNVPRALWDEAWFNARYVERHLPTTANEGFKSPIHMITGQKTRLSHIFPFGSLIYFAVDKQQISDLNLIHEHKRQFTLDKESMKVASVSKDIPLTKITKVVKDGSYTVQLSGQILLFSRSERKVMRELHLYLEEYSCLERNNWIKKYLFHQKLRNRLTLLICNTILQN
jgi:hypothetical protein